MPRRLAVGRGAHLSYLDEGAAAPDAPAVLMVHGNPTWSFYYRHLVRALAARGRRCLVPDHIGMGLSDQPQDYPYTLAQRIADLETLVAHAAPRSLDLVVHDWGGAIGLGFATRHPELIRRIVILNTAAFPAPHIPRRIALCKTHFPGTALVRGLNGFAWPATWMAMHRRQLTRLEKRAYLLAHGDWAGRAAVDAFVKDIPMDPAHPSWMTLCRVADGLAQFRDREVKIIWGGRDFCFHDWFFDQWRERFPQAQAHHLPDVGHYILDDAEPTVTPLIADFLTG
jgi:cis-3-alkyl-4-acyloxetan-2-one decarboxylase